MDGLLMRRMMMVGPELPPEYDKLEYIHCDGSSWIKTGLTSFKNTYTYELKIRPASTGTQFITTQNPNTTSENIGMFRTSDNSGKLWWQYAKVVGSVIRLSASLPNNIWHTIIATNGSLIVDGTTYTGAVASELTINERLYYGACSNAPADRPFVGDLSNYNVIDQNNNYLIQLVPARRRSDSVLGMYDKVSKTFLTNAGPGSFTY